VNDLREQGTWESVAVDNNAKQQLDIFLLTNGLETP
jgi:hypothetical protein